MAHFRLHRHDLFFFVRQVAIDLADVLIVEFLDFLLGVFLVIFGCFAGFDFFLQVLDADDEQTVVAALAELGLPTALGSAGDTRRLMDYVARDKKATGRRVRYVLLEGLGRPVMRDDVPDEAVVEVLHSLAGA